MPLKNCLYELQVQNVCVTQMNRQNLTIDKHNQTEHYNRR